MSFCDSYSMQAIDLIDRIARDTEDPRIRTWAQHTKVASLTAPMTIATTPNPYVGLLDMIAFVTLRRVLLEEYWIPELLGEQATSLLASYKAQEQEIWRIAEIILTPAEQQELRDHIAQWRQENPEQRFISHIRFSSFSRCRSIRPGDRGSAPSSIFQLFFIDPLAGADPLATELRHMRQLSERVFFFTERLPLLVTLMSQQMLTDAVSSPEMDRMLGEVEQATDAATKIADAAAAFPEAAGDQLHAAIADLDERVRIERQQAIEDFSQALAHERQAMLEQFEGIVERQREGFLGALEVRGSALDGTLTRLGETMAQATVTSDAVRAAADSLANMAAQFKNDDGDAARDHNPDDPDAYDELRSTAASFERAAIELNQLIAGIDQTLASARSPETQQALDRVMGDASRSISRRLLGTGLVLVGAIAAAMIIAPIIREAIARRLGWRDGAP